MIKQRTEGDFPLVVDSRVDILDYQDQLILPHNLAPVIWIENQKAVLDAFNFSLVPSWSKVRKPKFATHNARIETIAEKPTWRDSFKSRPCLVPLTDFIEPIYTGDFAGHMVSFSREDKNWLFAAGLWDEWSDPESGSILKSFTIITTEPPSFVAEIGHDRCPIFLDPKGASSWLKEVSQQKPAQKLEFLKTHQAPIDFEATKHRPMRPGWEKRK